MTAEDARTLKTIATEPEPRPEIVAALRECWNRAIEKAARAGRDNVAEGSISPLRTPIRLCEKQAVYDTLTVDGFQVKVIGGAAVVHW